MITGLGPCRSSPELYKAESVMWLDFQTWNEILSFESLDSRPDRSSLAIYALLLAEDIQSRWILEVRVSCRYRRCMRRHFEICWLYFCKEAKKDAQASEDAMHPMHTNKPASQPHVQEVRTSQKTRTPSHCKKSTRVLNNAATGSKHSRTTAKVPRGLRPTYSSLTRRLATT